MERQEPNLVKVTRKPKGPGDLDTIEHYVGYLVDYNGNDIETPEIGQPIYLTGEDKQNEPWLFATDAVYRIEVYATHWTITTEQGAEYDIENDRVIQ